MSEMTDDLERWQALRTQFVNITDPKKACRLPTTADIEQLEAMIGFRLPAGYRGFTQVFGPGTLIAGEEALRFYAPYAPEKPPAGSPGYSLLREAQTARESGGSIVGDDPRFYRFAGDSDFNVYGWVVDDVTDPEAPEYGVYCCRRFDDAFVKMARTFEGFVRLFTNQTEYRKRKHAKVFNPDIPDLTFDYFKRADGTEVLRPKGAAWWLRQFTQQDFEYR